MAATTTISSSSSNGSSSSGGKSNTATTLTTRHFKVPLAIIPILQREADTQQRSMGFIAREILVVATQKLAVKHEAEDQRARAAQVAQRRKLA